MYLQTGMRIRSVKKKQQQQQQARRRNSWWLALPLFAEVDDSIRLAGTLSSLLELGSFTPDYGGTATSGSSIVPFGRSRLAVIATLLTTLDCESNDRIERKIIHALAPFAYTSASTITNAPASTLICSLY